jgi:serine/threonine-protein kinase
MEPPGPSAHALSAALDTVLASAAFRGANRSSALLRYIVTAAVDGRAQYLKEYTLGVESLGRGESFDPRIDPIVRVEVSRLRARLARYYATEGLGDDVAIELPKGSYVPRFVQRSAGAVPPPSQAAPSDVGRPRRFSRTDALWVAGGVALAALFSSWYLAMAVPGLRRAAPPLRADIALGAPGTLAIQVGNSLALSPDGSTLAFVALGSDGGARLFVRRLEALEAVELEGTIGAHAPFFSPDGRWLGFYADGRVKKTLVAGGGSPIALAEAADFLGASWGVDGFIVARLDRSVNLWRVPEDGGAPTALPALDGELATLRWPQLLPDGRSVIGTTNTAAGGTAIGIARLDGGEQRMLVPAGLWGRYLASGHLAYVDRGALFVVPFDSERLAIEGSPVRVLDDVAHDPQFGFAQLDVAANGTLAYLRSPGSGLATVRWLDGGGVTRPILDEPARYQWPRLSPDGRRLAYGLLEGTDPDIWTLDFETGARERVTGAGNQSAPLWSPDSRFLFYTQTPDAGLFWQRADLGGGPRLLLRGSAAAWSMSPDGGRLAYHLWNPETSFDLWSVPIAATVEGVASGAPEPLLATRAFENYPAYSPDGRWLAYCSNDSGVPEVYVRAIPDDGNRTRVSANGGCLPAWSPRAARLFYETADRRLMSLDYRVAAGSFALGSASVWSDVLLADTGVLANFDVSPEGAVVALVAADATDPRPREHVTLVVGFFNDVESLTSAPGP